MHTSRIRHSLIIMVAGAFFGILCTSLMNVALPVLMKDFHIGTAEVQWVSNGFVMMNALMIPISAYFIKRWSFRRLFIIFLGIFIAGTAIGAIAPSFPILVCGRMVQAIGAGMMMPLVNVLAMNYALPGQQGRVNGVIGLAFNCSPIFGPVVSGVILKFLPWRWLFIFILPFTIVIFICACVLLPEIPHKAHPRFNTVGLITVTIGLFALLNGLSDISTNSFLSFDVLGYMIIGLVFLGIFVLTQNRSDHPLVYLKVFTNQQFRIATIINMLIVATMYGNAILIPLLVQNVQHQSTIISALTIFPGACLTGLLSTTSGRFYDKYSIRVLVTTGLTIDMIGTICQCLIGSQSSTLMVTIFQTVRQLGLVTMLIPIMTQAETSVPLKELPDAVATFNTLRQVAASLGTALIVGTIGIVDNFVGNSNSSRGIQGGFAVAFILLCIAMTLTPQLRHNPQQHLSK